MCLGEKLRCARLEAGMTQRQLCGEMITRNMLSQIENGKATPSTKTLRYLAQMLGKPVVITRYATSKDQLEDAVDGVIVPMDNEGCAAEITALLRDPEKMRMLSKNCKARDYSNVQEVEKLYKLMED